MSHNSDGFPPPPGNITDSTSRYAVTERSGEYSAINPYVSELSIFKGREFAKLDRVTQDDFFKCTSAIDSEPRYIRKSFVESLATHKDGCIVRTYSGDFHVVKESSRSILDALDSRPVQDWERTNQRQLETAFRDLRRRLDKMEDKLKEESKHVGMSSVRSQDV